MKTAAKKQKRSSKDNAFGLLAPPFSTPPLAIITELELMIFSWQSYSKTSGFSKALPYFLQAQQ